MKSIAKSVGAFAFLIVQLIIVCSLPAALSKSSDTAPLIQSAGRKTVDTAPLIQSDERKAVDRMSQSVKSAPAPDSKIIDAPYINQRPKFPTGCESVSAVMALRYLGIDITAGEFIDNFLKTADVPRETNGVMTGSSPWEAFIGDPRSPYGFGCYAPVIKAALDKAVDREKYTVQELYGAPLDELCERYISRDIPVILWATINMQPPREGRSWYLIDGEKFTWTAPMHCLLLTGYDRKYCYFNDPLTKKNQRYPKSACEKAYKAMFSQAVVIEER